MRGRSNIQQLDDQLRSGHCPLTCDWPRKFISRLWLVGARQRRSDGPAERVTGPPPRVPRLPSGGAGERRPPRRRSPRTRYRYLILQSRPAMQALWPCPVHTPLTQRDQHLMPPTPVSSEHDPGADWKGGSLPVPLEVATPTTVMMVIATAPSCSAPAHRPPRLSRVMRTDGCQRSFDPAAHQPFGRSPSPMSQVRAQATRRCDHSTRPGPRSRLALALGKVENGAAGRDRGCNG